MGIVWGFDHGDIGSMLVLCIINTPATPGQLLTFSPLITGPPFQVALGLVQGDTLAFFELWPGKPAAVVAQQEQAGHGPAPSFSRSCSFVPFRDGGTWPSKIQCSNGR